MKKSLKFIALGLVLGISVPAFIGTFKVNSASGYSASSLPTTIDLNDTSASNIRSYYSSLNNLSQSERQGTNLLKNLKTILKNGQKYYSYESGENVWKMYEITDRDWDKSPASAISGYNSSTKKITGYSYNSSNPYLHALYVNRDVNNQTTAWSDHQQTQWGINREHVWPKAEGFDSSGAGGARGDPRHLMAGNGYANNIHSNYYYGYVKSSGATDCGSKYSNLSGNLKGTSQYANTGTVFEPQDSDKGDIARSIFYMVARYNYLSGSDSDGINANNPNLTLTQNISDWSSSGYTSTTSNPGKLGILTDLLAWHHADPVDEYEIHRNNLLYTNFTNNRNPFVDFPEWVDFIWGTATYNGKQYQSYSSTPTGYATPSSDTINGYNGGSSDPVSVTGVSVSPTSTSIKVGSSELLSAAVSPNNATNQGVTWTSSNTNVATVSNVGRISAVAEGNATITVTTSDGGFTATCAVTVTASGGGGEVSSAVFTMGEDGATSHADGSSVTSYTETKSGVTLTLSDGVKMYSGARDETGNGCLKFGTSSAGGSFVVDLTGISNLIQVIFRAANYKATTSTTITINSGSPTTLTKQSNNGQYDEVSVNISSQTSLSVEFSARAMLNEIEFVFSSSSSKVLDSITLDTSDAPTTFNVGDTFSYEGLSVTANYDDGTDDIVTPTNVTTPDMSTAGQKTVTVSYEEDGVTKTAQYTITVNAVTLTSIEVSNAKTSYYVGDSFVKPTVTATFSNGSTSDVTNSATFTGYNMSTSGNQTVTVSYGGQTTTYQITVSESSGTQTEEGSVTASSSTLEGWTLVGTGTYSDGSVKFGSAGNNVYKLDIFTTPVSTNMVSLTVTINGKINGTPTAANSYKVEALDSSGNVLTSDVQTGAEVVTTSYGDTVFTIDSGLTGCTGLKITYVTKGGGNWGIMSISWVAEYSTSSDPVTSISATVSKTYHPGETIVAGDVTVKDNNLNIVSTFTLVNAGYQFTYDDAPSGGTAGTKQFTVTASPAGEQLSCTLTVNVTRTNYSSPASSSLTHTGAEFKTAGIGTSYATGQTATVDGITFSIDGYVYNNTKLSLSSSSTSAAGHVINTTSYQTGITNVTVSGATPDIQLSVDGSEDSWVDLANATPNSVNYFFLKIFYKNTYQGSYVNITQIEVTLKGQETAINVANYVMYEDTNNQCTTKYSVAKCYFGNMSTSEKSTFMTSSDYVIATARERFEAWARYNGETITYSNGTYSISRIQPINVVGNKVSSDSVALIVIISILGIGVVGGYFYLRKKKHE